MKPYLFLLFWLFAYSVAPASAASPCLPKQARVQKMGAKIEKIARKIKREKGNGKGTGWIILLIVGVLVGLALVIGAFFMKNLVLLISMVALGLYIFVYSIVPLLIVVGISRIK